MCVSSSIVSNVCNIIIHTCDYIYSEEGYSIEYANQITLAM